MLVYGGRRMTGEPPHAAELIAVVQEMIHGTLQIMKEDWFHCPADWLLENWWNTLDIARREIISDASEVQPSDDSDAQVP